MPERSTLKFDIISLGVMEHQDITTLRVPTKDNFADILTKATIEGRTYASFRNQL